jgi:hypothetical protein
LLYAKRVQAMRTALAALSVGVLITTAGASTNDSAFQKQLRLARKEGLATNAAEYKAGIRPARPAENAAPLYKKLYKEEMARSDVFYSDRDMLWKPTPQAINKAEQVLIKHRKQLAILDIATSRPRCWFNRDWTKGAAVVMPLAPLEEGAKLLLFRGSVAAANGDAAAAVRDCERAFSIARHVSEEPTEIAYRVRLAIYQFGIWHLAYWTFKHPGQPTYVRALKSAIAHLPQTEPAAVHRGDLFNILSSIELTGTAKGRGELGFRDSNVGAFDKIAPHLINQRRALAHVVYAERMLWFMRKHPAKFSANDFENAKSNLHVAMAGFPLAYEVYGDFYSLGEKEEAGNPSRLRANQEQFSACLRALSHEVIPRSIRTDDLLSPYDGKPTKYSYDGLQMVIQVSGYKNDRGPLFIKMPPSLVVKH